MSRVADFSQVATGPFGVSELVDPAQVRLTVAEAQAVAETDLLLHPAEPSIDKLEAVAARFSPGDADRLRLPPPGRRSAVPGSLERRLSALLSRVAQSEVQLGLSDPNSTRAVESMFVALANLSAIHSQVDRRIRGSR